MFSGEHTSWLKKKDSGGGNISLAPRTPHCPRRKVMPVGTSLRRARTRCCVLCARLHKRASRFARDFTRQSIPAGPSHRRDCCSRRACSIRTKRMRTGSSSERARVRRGQRGDSDLCCRVRPLLAPTPESCY